MNGPDDTNDDSAGADLDDILRRLGRDATSTEQLLPLVYAELRDMADRLMLGEKADHTLQPTALVHEAFLRLTASRNVGEQGRLHFLKAAAVTMRRVLVDHARARRAAKRGGDWQRITLSGLDPARADDATDDIDLLRLDELLAELEELDPRQARIVELRFFGDLTGKEIAEVLDISRQTVVRELAMARAWLKRGLGA